ncbi:MAG: hypothetical protein ACHQRM_08250 [Bacteroidia bacterium]
MHKTPSPAEFVYLDRMWWTDGAQMLKLTLQELCLMQVLAVSRRLTVEHVRDKRAFPRFYFTRGPKFAQLDKTSESYSFFYDLFKDREEYKFADLKNAIRSALFNNTDNFSKYYTKADLEREGIITFRYFRTREGHKQHRQITALLDETDKHIDYLLNKDKDELLHNLDALGTCVLLLDEETIGKLKTVSKDVAAIRNLEFLTILDSNYTSFDNYFYMSGFGFGSSGGDYGGDSGGDFGGFGGGDGGGGGGGGDW